MSFCSNFWGVHNWRRFFLYHFFLSTTPVRHVNAGPKQGGVMGEGGDNMRVCIFALFAALAPLLVCSLLYWKLLLDFKLGVYFKGQTLVQSFNSKTHLVYRGRRGGVGEKKRKRAASNAL